MNNLIEIDGGMLLGGGQILRTSLALSALTGNELHIKNIRSGRPKPGLRPQHLASAKTIASICNAELKEALLGSTELFFNPQNVSKTNLNVGIGTAGSISLLLSQILPVSLLEETRLHVSGGTNVPFSPPMEFLQRVLFPVLHKMGARPEASVSKLGYFPKGNGTVSFSSKPARLPLKPISLTEFGSLEFVRIFSHCASLPKRVAESQAIAARHALRILNTEFEEKIDCRENVETIGSGITLFAHTSSNVVLSGSALGRKGLPAEEVGKEAAKNLLKELNAGQACDSHLSDQLIPFMAFASGRSEVHATALTKHCVTNIAVVEKFLPVKFSVEGSLGVPAKISVEGNAFSV